MRKARESCAQMVREDPGITQISRTKARSNLDVVTKQFINQTQAIRVSANKNRAIGGSGICITAFGRMLFTVLLMISLSPLKNGILNAHTA